MAQKTLLIILDGWGKSKNRKVSAVDQANTPYIDFLYDEYEHSILRTDGKHVGLPEALEAYEKTVEHIIYTLLDE